MEKNLIGSKSSDFTPCLSPFIENYSVNWIHVGKVLLIFVFELTVLNDIFFDTIEATDKWFVFIKNQRLPVIQVQ